MQPVPRQNVFGRLRSALMSGAAASGLVAFGAPPAAALDAGDIGATQNIASVNTAGGTTTITPSASRSILDWKNFNLTSKETLEFHFGNRDWIALNRVNQGSAAIDGTLSGCVGPCPNFGGNIWIYAADGVLFGPNARVNTGGLLATTSPLSTSDSAFLSSGADKISAFAFGAAKPGTSIQIQGGAEINSSGGSLAFVAPMIASDAGSLVTTPPGASTVDYRAVSSFRIQFARDVNSDLDLLTFEIPASSQEGSDSATPITLRGNTVAGNVFVASVAKSSVMHALISAEGTVVATAAQAQGGDIVLLGDNTVARSSAPSGAVDVAVSGTLKAEHVRAETDGAITVSGNAIARTAAGDGGAITVTGDTVTLTDGSLLDASGEEGGLVLVGGDVHGGKVADERFASDTVPTAAAVTMTSGARIKADGTRGAGGRVVLWSDKETDFQGEISATGDHGDGGFAEVSGEHLTFTGLVDLSSIDAGQGTLLLDPANIIITATSTDATSTGDNTVGITDLPIDGVADSTIAAALINRQLGSANVVVTTQNTNGGATGNITVAADVTNGNANGGNLTLTAFNDINIAANITIAGAHALTLNALTGNISQTAGVVTAGTLGGFIGGAVSLNDANLIGNLGTLISFGTDLSLTNAQSLAITGFVSVPGTLTLTVAGGISEAAGGSISAGTLTGSSSTFTSLSSPFNTIGNLGTFTAGTSFSLTNDVALAVTGNVTASAGSLSITTIGGTATVGEGNSTIDADAHIEIDGSLTAIGDTSDVILTTGGWTASPADNDVTLKSYIKTNSPGVSIIGRHVSLTTGDINVAGSGNQTITADNSIDVSNTTITASGITGGSVTATGIFLKTGNVVINITGDVDNVLGALGDETVTIKDSITAKSSTLTGSGDGAANGIWLETGTGNISIDTATSLGNATVFTDAFIDASGSTLRGTARNAGEGIYLATGSGIVTIGNAIPTLGATNITENRWISTGGSTFTGSGIGAYGVHLQTASEGITIGAASGSAGATTVDSENDIRATNSTIDGTSAGTDGVLILTGVANVTVGGNTTQLGTTGITAKASIDASSSTITDTSLLLPANLTTSGINIALGTAPVALGNASATTAIDAGNITTSAGGVFMQSANPVFTIGAVAVQQGNASIPLSADLTLRGNIDAPNQTVTLISAGGISEAAGGTIAADTLTGSSTGATTLNNANLVNTLAAFRAGTDFSLTNAQTLTVGGSDIRNLGFTGITAGAGGESGNLALTTTAGDLNIGTSLLAQNATAQQTVTLIAAGNIAENAGGLITTDRLTGSSGGAAVLDNNNQIAILGNFQAGADFSLTDGLVLTVAGPVKAGSGGAFGNLTIVGATDITLSGDITAKGATTTEIVTLIATRGSITQTGGVITADELTGTAGGSVALNDANAIDVLEAFRAGSDFSLTNRHPLDVRGESVNPRTGNIIGITAAFGNLSLATQAGDPLGANLTFSTALTAQGSQGDQSITLRSAGAITENAGGALSTDTLTGSSAGNASLSSLNTNTVATIANFSSGGSLTYKNQTALLVSNVSATTTLEIDAGGALTIGTNGTDGVSGGTVSLSAITAGDVLLNANVSGTTGVALNSATGNVTQNAGIVTTGVLSGNAFLSAKLDHANKVAAVDGFTAAAFSLTDAQSLSVQGAGLTATSGNLTVTTTGAGSNMTLSGNLTAAGASQVVTLISSADMTQSGSGIITAGTLTGSAAGSATLLNPNLVTTLGTFPTGGDFAFADAKPLTVTLAIAAGGNVTLVTTAQNDLVLNSNITAGGAGIVALQAGGNLTQAAGLITATALTGSSGAATTLSGLNPISTLHAFHAGGDLTFSTPNALLVDGLDVRSLGFSGVTSPGNIRLSANGALTVSGIVNANLGVALHSPSAITIANGGNVLAGADITIDPDTILVAGSVTAAGNIVMTATTSIDVRSTGVVDAGQNATLTLSCAECSPTLGSFINISGTARAGSRGNNGNLTLDAGSVGTGNITLSGTLAAEGAIVPQLVTLRANTSITQTAGAITADELTGIAAGSVSLAGNNRIDILEAFSAGADFSLTNQHALVIQGASVNPKLLGKAAGVTATSGNLALTTTGAGSDLTLGANLTAGAATGAQSVTLISSGTINQTGGVITAHALTGQSAGTTALGGANAIGVLDAFRAGADFTLSDARALDVPGTDIRGLGFSGITATTGNLAIVTTGAGSDLALGTGLNAGAGTRAVSLTSAGALTANAGTIAGGNVSLTAAGDLTLGPNAGGVTAQNARFVSTGGSYVQNGGTISAPAVSIAANRAILIGDPAFTAAAGAATNPLGLPAGSLANSGHIFIDTQSVTVQAPDRIVTENTGSAANPAGLRIAGAAPLIRSIGQPAFLDLFGTLNDNGTEIPAISVSLSNRVVVDGTNVDWRINGCAIHIASACAPISLQNNIPLLENVQGFQSATFGRLTVPRINDVLLPVEAGANAEQNDPLLLGSGNDEISQGDLLFLGAGNDETLMDDNTRTNNR